MLREQAWDEWQGLKPRISQVKAELSQTIEEEALAQQKLNQAEKYLGIYRSSRMLELEIKSEREVIDFLKQHTNSWNGQFFVFLSLLIKQLTLEDRGIDLTSLPAIYRLSINGRIKEDFKVRCNVKEASGNHGFGFKRIEDSHQWTGIIGDRVEKVYVPKKDQVSTKRTRGETWDGNAPVVDEIRFLGGNG